jgi:hypothetical protein
MHASRAKPLAMPPNGCIVRGLDHHGLPYRRDVAPHSLEPP